MLLRFIEVTDDVTGTTEESVEEFNKVEYKFKTDIEDGKHFLELWGDDEFKGVKVVIDFTDDETDKLIESFQMLKK